MKRALLIFGIAVGAILALGPLWVFGGTVIGMHRALQTFADNGIQDPRALAAEVEQTLMSNSIGLIACPLGLGLLVTCIVLLANRKRQALPPPLPPASGPSSSHPLS